VAWLRRGASHQPLQEKPACVFRTLRCGGKDSLVATDKWIIITFQPILWAMRSRTGLLDGANHRALVDHRRRVLDLMIRIMEATQVVPVVVVPHHDATLWVFATCSPCLLEREKILIVRDARRAIVLRRASLVWMVEVRRWRIAVLMVAPICVWILAAILLD